MVTGVTELSMEETGKKGSKRKKLGWPRTVGQFIYMKRLLYALWAFE